ncbi:uncharacterized protein LOC106464877 [Limulus polyphemus]|uniref:Uncharacterized protein LOC106464877 n=1 Tax=Limulus polyphemus TaxID=6850 RepID=A0ABM1BER0_LIMPO|nr:uncharacterized protein LOC106464877 [Limulus polyphemus]
METSYIVCLVLAFGFYQVYSQNCHLREIDVCAAGLLQSIQTQEFPQTEEDLNRECSQIQEAGNCLSNYTKTCMTLVQREIFGFFGEGPENLINEYCKSGTSVREQYLKNAACLNGAFDENQNCFQDLQAALEVVAGTQFGNRITIACCTYRRFEGCFRDNLESKCGKEAVDFIQELLRMAVSRLPDIICTGFDPKSNECTSVLPASGTKPEGEQSNLALSRLLSTYFTSS